MGWLNTVGDYLKDNPEVVNTAVGAVSNGINSATSGSSSGSKDGSLDLFSKVFGSIKIDANSSQLDTLKTPLIVAGIALLALLAFSFFKKK